MIGRGHRRIIACMKTILTAFLILLAMAPITAQANSNYYNATLAAEAEAAAKLKPQAQLPSPPQAGESEGGGMTTDTLPNAGFSRVTTLESCLTLLPEADRIEVKTRYSMPYRECQRRVTSLKSKALAAQLAQNEAPPKLPAGWKFLQVWKKKDTDKEPKP